MIRSVTLFASAAVIVLALSSAPIAAGQVAKDGSDARFYDDLLDRFVGRWEVNAVAYGQKFTLEREAEWVLEHQYLRVHETSREVVPWLKVPFERFLFIGYNHRKNRYVVHEMNVHGGDSPFEPEGFAYAFRTGDELIFEHKNGAEVFAKSRWTWDRASSTWLNQARRVVDGKELEPHLEQIAVAAKPAIVPNRAERSDESAKKLLDLQQAWATARMKGDVAFLENLYAKEFLITAMNGAVVERSMDIAVFASGELKPESITHEDMAVSVYDDTAVVTGLENVRGTYKGNFGAFALRFTNVFVNRDGRWQLVTHHSTEVRTK